MPTEGCRRGKNKCALATLEGQVNHGLNEAALVIYGTIALAQGILRLQPRGHETEINNR